MGENGKLQEKVKAEFTAMTDEPLTDEERGFLDGWEDARREIKRLQGEITTLRRECAKYLDEDLLNEFANLCLAYPNEARLTLFEKVFATLNQD